MFLKTISKFTHFSLKKRPAQRFYHYFTIKRQNMKPYPVIARQHKPPRSPPQHYRRKALRHPRPHQDFRGKTHRFS